MDAASGDTERYAKQYPHLASALRKVATLVAKLRSQPEAELEARLGCIRSNGTFTAGVSRKEIDRIIHMMESSTHIDGKDEWIEEQDFMYTVSGNDTYRTRVKYTSNSLMIEPETICKEKLGSEDFRVVHKSLPYTVPDVRVSLKMEEAATNVPTCIQTHLVRIKQRRRFFTKDGLWAFDFAMSWADRTKTGAELKQATTDPIFEIECELVDAQRALGTQSDAHIATSLLLKACDLLPLHTSGYVQQFQLR